MFHLQDIFGQKDVWVSPSVYLCGHPKKDFYVSPKECLYVSPKEYLRIWMGNFINSLLFLHKEGVPPSSHLCKFIHLIVVENIPICFSNFPE